jgi:RNA polymerase sigma factor (sigma-70 family)
LTNNPVPEDELTKTDDTFTDACKDEFGVRVYERALTLAKKRYEKGSDAGAHDIAMNVFLKFWSNPNEIMSSYEPEVYAAVSLSHRADDWRRTERIQRGEGARLTEINGRRVSSRAVESLDEFMSVDGYTSLGLADFDDVIINRVDLQKALKVLSEFQRLLILNVDFLGYSVVQVSESLGLGRPHCQREIQKARQMIRDFVTAA